MSSVSTRPRVELVLCRHEEDIEWAMRLLSRVPRGRLKLVVYNNGPPLQQLNLTLSAELRPLVEERMVPNVGREAYCYVRHLLAVKRRGGSDATSIPELFVFSQGQPTCTGKHPAQYSRRRSKQSKSERREACGQLRAQQIQALALSDDVTLQPRGFVDLDATSAVSWDAGALELSDPAIRRCWASELANLTGGQISMSANAQLYRITYSPWAQFAVARSNVHATPLQWLEHARAALEASEPFPWAAPMQNTSGSPTGRRQKVSKNDERGTCCRRGRTCLPWILERMWGALLSTSSANLSLAYRFKMSRASTAWRMITGMLPAEHEALIDALRVSSDVTEVRLTSQRLRKALARAPLERNLTAWAIKTRTRLLAARHLRRWNRDPELREVVDTTCTSLLSNLTLLQTIPRIEMAPPSHANISVSTIINYSGAPRHSRLHELLLASALARMYGNCISLQLQVPPEEQASNPLTDSPPQANQNDLHALQLACLIIHGLTCVHALLYDACAQGDFRAGTWLDLLGGARWLVGGYTR